MQVDVSNITLKQKIERIKKSLVIKDYNTAINLMISVYEEAFKTLYKKYLGQLKNPKQIIETLVECSKNKTNIDDLMFGHFIAFFNHSSFIEEVMDIINSDKKFDKKEFLKNISELNELRVNDVHALNNIDQIAEEYINLKYNYLVLFLRIFNLTEGSSLPIEYGTLRTQKIIGEIQLYKSLNEVLYKEDVNCLDTTYFSVKLPDEQKYEEIYDYWNEVNRRVHSQDLILRRVISLHDEDNKGQKLLWLLFNQIPRYFTLLSKSIFLRVFQTSRIKKYKEANKSVNLINIILLYSKSTPNRGHVWLFSSHPEIHVSEREYIHVYGDNISTFRNIFNDIFNSSDECDTEVIKKLISQRSRGEVNFERIMEIATSLYEKKEIIYSKETLDTIQDVYSSIFAEEDVEDDEEFLF